MTRALAFVFLLFVYPSGWLALWHVFAVTMIIGAVEPLFRPTSMAYIAHILPKDLLQKANALLEGTLQTLMLLGPGLGGLLISTFDVSVVVMILVVALGSSSIILLLIPSHYGHKEDERKTWLRDFTEGLHFFKEYRVLLWLGLLLLVINFAVGAAMPLFLPYVIENLGGTETNYGLFVSAFSIGMVLGSFITGLTGTPKDLRLTFLSCMFANGTLFVFLGYTSVFAVAFIISVLQGLAASLININNTTYYQKRVPEYIRGRVFSVRFLLAQIGIPIGAGLGGFLAETFSIKLLFISIGCLIVTTSLMALSLRALHDLNDKTLDKPVEMSHNL
ncbi:MFS transporter [Caldalkalibacillus salinus]|uniref:MFS transporter n=1 Tax=Caldalkalibacillus salinus TaxID=2803787 RepID=UPI0019215BC2|nr:MFS transporter [Caldalkalibacillus salinus]